MLELYGYGNRLIFHCCSTRALRPEPSQRSAQVWRGNPNEACKSGCSIQTKQVSRIFAMCFQAFLYGILLVNARHESPIGKTTSGLMRPNTKVEKGSRRHACRRSHYQLLEGGGWGSVTSQASLRGHARSNAQGTTNIFATALS